MASRPSIKSGSSRASKSSYEGGNFTEDTWEFDEGAEVEGFEDGTLTDIGRGETFLTPPPTGWLHDAFALSYGEGVYYSFPVLYLGSIRLNKSLRKIEFSMREKVVKEAIHLVREASNTRRPIDRAFHAEFDEFFTGVEPIIDIHDIDISISTSGIVWASNKKETIMANHRLPNISFALGGDFEDYEIISYVAKCRGDARECHVFQCGSFSNQVLATIGQAFVFAGHEHEIEVPVEYSETALANYALVTPVYGEAAGVGYGQHPAASAVAGRSGRPSYEYIDDGALAYETATVSQQARAAQAVYEVIKYRSDPNYDRATDDEAIYAEIPFQGEWDVVDGPRASVFQGYSFADAEFAEYHTADDHDVDAPRHHVPEGTYVEPDDVGASMSLPEAAADGGLIPKAVVVKPSVHAMHAGNTRKMKQLMAHNGPIGRRRSSRAAPLRRHTVQGARASTASEDYDNRPRGLDTAPPAAGGLDKAVSLVTIPAPMGDHALQTGAAGSVGSVVYAGDGADGPRADRRPSMAVYSQVFGSKSSRHASRTSSDHDLYHDPVIGATSEYFESAGAAEGEDYIVKAPGRGLLESKKGGSSKEKTKAAKDKSKPAAAVVNDEDPDSYMTTTADDEFAPVTQFGRRVLHDVDGPAYLAVDDRVGGDGGDDDDDDLYFTIEPAAANDADNDNYMQLDEAQVKAKATELAKAIATTDDYFQIDRATEAMEALQLFSEQEDPNYLDMTTEQRVDRARYLAGLVAQNEADSDYITLDNDTRAVRERALEALKSSLAAVPDRKMSRMMRLRAGSAKLVESLAGGGRSSARSSVRSVGGKAGSYSLEGGVYLDAKDLKPPVRRPSSVRRQTGGAAGIYMDPAVPSVARAPSYREGTSSVSRQSSERAKSVGSTVRVEQAYRSTRVGGGSAAVAAASTTTAVEDAPTRKESRVGAFFKSLRKSSKAASAPAPAPTTDQPSATVSLRKKQSDSLVRKLNAEQGNGASARWSYFDPEKLKAAEAVDAGAADLY